MVLLHVSPFQSMCARTHCRSSNFQSAAGEQGWWLGPKPLVGSGGLGTGPAAPCKTWGCCSTPSTPTSCAYAFNHCYQGQVPMCALEVQGSIVHYQSFEPSTPLFVFLWSDPLLFYHFVINLHAELFAIILLVCVLIFLFTSREITEVFR